MELRRALNEPISAIFVAARLLLRATECHLEGDTSGAAELLEQANLKEVWTFTDRAWGKGAAARYDFQINTDLPPHLPFPLRPQPRMPNTSTRKAAIERDGYHCRFCGIPVIDASLRRMFTIAYPTAAAWGTTNISQHAAFHCMWLQFDHLLPNSRGGSSSLGNIVVTCAPCNFGRMEATLEEARLLDPLTLAPPVVWELHAQWDGLERFRTVG